MLTLIFWVGLSIVFYAYVGYGLLLFVLVRIKRLFATPPSALFYEPDIAFVVCAYNEEDWIASKIENSIAVQYPKTKIQFWFVTDGSDDRTPEIIRNFPFPADIQWHLLHKPQRNGKIAAFQRAMEHIKAEIVISTDANTMINPEAVAKMTAVFADPKVGAVAGEKRIKMDQKNDAGSAGEGVYWLYESKLKAWDAELWSVVGAAGELFGFRLTAYEHVPSDTIVEDFYLTMRIAQKGWRVQYEPAAYAVETSSASVKEELKRKVRIAAGGIQAVVRLAPLLNIFRYGILSFQYISHRVLRWTIAPLLLPLLLVINIALAIKGLFFYKTCLVFHVLFYLAAISGWILEQKKLKLKIFFIPYYFCLMNYAMFAGFFRYIRGKQSVLWEKAKRS